MPPTETYVHKFKGISTHKGMVYVRCQQLMNSRNTYITEQLASWYAKRFGQKLCRTCFPKVESSSKSTV